LFYFQLSPWADRAVLFSTRFLRSKKPFLFFRFPDEMKLWVFFFPIYWAGQQLSSFVFFYFNGLPLTPRGSIVLNMGNQLGAVRHADAPEGSPHMLDKFCPLRVRVHFHARFDPVVLSDTFYFLLFGHETSYPPPSFFLSFLFCFVSPTFFKPVRASCQASRPFLPFPLFGVCQDRTHVLASFSSTDSQRIFLLSFFSLFPPVVCSLPRLILWWCFPFSFSQPIEFFWSPRSFELQHPFFFQPLY